MSSVVTRDGKRVSPVLADENAAYTWLQKHQPMSWDWAIKYEGYAVVNVTEYQWGFYQDGDDITAIFHAPLEADLVRAWEDDLCLIEVTAVGDRWMVTGGNGEWEALAERKFDSYGEALADYARLHQLEVREKP